MIHVADRMAHVRFNIRGERYREVLRLPLDG